MDESLLQKHIQNFMEDIKQHPDKHENEYQERIEFTQFYRSYTKEKLLKMN